MRTSAIALLTVLVVVSGFAPAAGAFDANATQDAVECEYPLTLTDATGEEVTVDEEPESVVALQPSDAQTTFEIGAEDKVVGMPVSQYTDYLDAGDRTDITEDDGTTVVAERVIDLEPDVVIAANTATFQDGLIEQLRDAGLTVYVYDSASSIDEIQEQTQVAGQLTGECEGAQETVDWMNERIDAYESAVGEEDRPLGYFAMGDGYTPGNNTFQHEMLTVAGLENVALRADIDGWGTISDEVVVEEDPEWIVHPDWAEEPPVAESVQGTTAYENENFVAVNDNYVNQPAPRIVLAIEEIIEAVHPETYEEVQAELEESEDTETEATETDGSDGETETETETETDADEGDSIPGFGVPAAVAAVLAAVGLLSRRH